MNPHFYFIPGFFHSGNRFQEDFRGEKIVEVPIGGSLGGKVGQNWKSSHYFQTWQFRFLTDEKHESDRFEPIRAQPDRVLEYLRP